MKIRAIYLLAFILVAGACQNSPESAGNNEELSVIPKPVKVKFNKGTFTVKNNTVIYYQNNDLISVAEYLGKMLSDTADLNIKIKEGSGRGINLRFAGGEEKITGEEGYRLNITPGSIDLYANKSGGIFYGIQTLLQMLPPGQESCKATSSGGLRKYWKKRGKN